MQERVVGDFETDGVAIFPRVAAASVVEVLRNHFQSCGRIGPGVRGFQLPSSVTDFIGGGLGALANRLTGRPMRPVRIVLFDKSPRSNWAVPWHQDRTIAVKARHDVPGFSPWSVKDGVIHVEPPVSVLEEMVTLRLFIDDCDARNGPLEVARGSHRRGRVPAKDAKCIAEGSEIFIATGRVADVLAMRLLAIHSSRKAAAPDHRRVLHVDYASGELPKPIEWAAAFG